MRDEMLKRLDALLARVSRDLPVWEEWQALHRELAAERCENCAHWNMTNRGDGPEVANDELPESFAHLKTCGGLDEFRVDDYTSFYQGTATGPGFCCSHFEKKELAK